MSSLVHAPSNSAPETRPVLRLLERPVRPAPASIAVVREEPAGAWLRRAFERFWAWAERSQHHRLGSWLRH
jgi:hypothetical protein